LPENVLCSIQPVEYYFLFQYSGKKGTEKNTMSFQLFLKKVIQLMVKEIKYLMSCVKVKNFKFLLSLKNPVLTGALIFYVNADNAIDTFSFFSERYSTADVGFFLFHKSNAFRRDYLMEANFNNSFNFISYRNIHSVWDITAEIGVGRQFENVIFDPRWLAIGITPGIEYRARHVIFGIAVDRRCFHEVDRLPDKMTVYWTQPFLYCGTKEFRSNNSNHNRISAYLKVGIFSNWFFGYPTDLASGGHDYRFVIDSKFKYVLLKRQKWDLKAANQAAVYISRNRRAHLAEAIEISNTFYGNAFDVDIFFNYSLFDNQIEYKNMNRDRLLKMGIRFSY
jgi:hypothetical protein